MANVAATPVARMILVAIGLLPTLVLGTLAAYGLYFTVPRNSEASNGWYFWILIPSLLGAIGLIAAWVRVIVSPRMFQKSSLLRILVIVGLGVGLLISIFYALGSPITSLFFWFMITISMIGIFLIGATLGEGIRSNN